MCSPADVTLTGGPGTLSVTSLPIGVQNITAAYSGDAAHSGSTSLASAVDVTYSSSITVTVADRAGNMSTAPFTLTIQ